MDIPSTLNPTGSFDEGGITYKRMTCDFNKSFPTQTGSYSYTAVISPGAVQPDVTFTGSSDLGRCVIVVVSSDVGRYM